ncbi:DUF1513 domain-containing protein [Algirhabdus cladophorae]|uniref:DUF1513 domain-containing protein n=1 Tax=Algirhabdus cladophorae TaxID=3377108 RepID=UPI003B846BC8
MEAGRRQFIAGLLASGLVPKPTWADAGSPSFLSAAALPDGAYVLCGIDADLNITFQLPLPARGHAAAAHPLKPEAVAFARRPGTFAVVIDCATGVQKAVLTALAGRHFYGHGAFSGDGSLLFTTENDYEAGRGRIGVWDVASGYTRIDEWDSGGIGPHDIKRLPNSDVLVVANGGIDTHPDTGRTKLNIATMQPNLSYIQNGTVIDTVELPPEMHKNSIRHLAVSNEGQVAFGMQWQGDGVPISLVGHHSIGREVVLMRASPDRIRDMQGYVGSIAYAFDGTTIVVTSPRGNSVQHYDAASAQIVAADSVSDVCGVATTVDGFMLTAGTGELAFSTWTCKVVSKFEAVQWDNHLISI